MPGCCATGREQCHCPRAIGKGNNPSLRKSNEKPTVGLGKYNASVTDQLEEGAEGSICQNCHSQTLHFLLWL